MRNKLIGLAAALAMSLGAAWADAKTKACWVYVGPVGDHGWTYQHDQGRMAVEKEPWRHRPPCPDRTRS